MSTRMLSRMLWIWLVSMVLGSATVAFCQANLIKNRSFERPIVTPGTYEKFFTGETLMNWNVIGDPGSVTLVSGTFSEEGFDFPAKEGIQWLDLTGNSQTSTGVSQTVSTTPGAAYTLSFWVGNVYDPHGGFGIRSTVIVQVDGQQVYTATTSRGKGKTAMTWRHFATTIVATSLQTTIAFLNGDPPNDTANGLDAVTLVLQSE